MALIDHEQAWDTLSRFFTAVVSEDDRLDRRLADLGLTCADITDVALTHLHLDHAGGLGLFPNARRWVQLAEYRAALYPDRLAGGGYLPQEWGDTSDSCGFLAGDHIVAPGIHVIATPGQPAGHQSVLVNLASAGWFWLVGDVVDSEILDRRRAPGVIADLGQALLSARRLRALEQSFGAQPLFTHGHEQHEQLPGFPLSIARRPAANEVA